MTWSCPPLHAATLDTPRQAARRPPPYAAHTREAEREGRKIKRGNDRALYFSFFANWVYVDATCIPRRRKTAQD